MNNVSPGEHEQSKQVAIDMLIDSERKENVRVMQATVQELEKTIYPKKQETESIFIQQTTDLLDEYS